MIRTVVYDPRPRVSQDQPDGFSDKLTKDIPGEA
jgi:hypothetical protein